MQMNTPTVRLRSNKIKLHSSSYTTHSKPSFKVTVDYFLNNLLW